MPSITGFASEEQKEFIEDELVEDGPYDDTSEVVQGALSYFLHNKYNQEK